jgi:predicted HTH domain antitoxin
MQLPDVLAQLRLNRDFISQAVAWQKFPVQPARFQPIRLKFDSRRDRRNFLHLTPDISAIMELYLGKRIKMNTRQITIDVPEKILLAEKSDEATFGKELRLLAAIKLFELGRLSSGRAAELAGMPRVEFLLTLGKYKVFPLLDELDDLEREHGQRNQ